jgi:hypothetical protein
MSLFYEQNKGARRDGRSTVQEGSFFILAQVAIGFIDTDSATKSAHCFHLQFPIFFKKY